MEPDELKSMWLLNDANLEKKLRLNEQSVALLQTQKLVSKLAPLYRQRWVEITFHILAILLLTGFLAKNFFQFPYAASAVVLLAFYTITLWNAIQQIRIIKTLDYGEDLATLQSALLILQTHRLNYARLSVLFIPAFLAFPVIVTKVISDYNIKTMSGFDILKQSNGNWELVQFISFMVLIPLGVWFYREVSYKNIDKRWVKNFIQKSSGTRVTKALEFLNELQNLKRETI